MSLPAVGQPATEPKNGDFVAYIEEIERRQLAAVKLPQMADQPRTAADAAGAPLSAAQADALRDRLRASGAGGRSFIGAALLGLFGLFLLFQGLLADGGAIAALVGAFLLWRAWVAARKAVRESLPADQAVRLVDALREAQKQSRR